MELLISAILIILLGSFAWAGYSAAPWVPTRKHHVERAITLTNVRSGNLFIDLGCGDGRMVAEAARRGANAIGYEISIIPYVIAKFRTWPIRDRCHIKYQNFWTADLSQADIIYIFLMPESTQKLRDKFNLELKSGTRVISYVWQFTDWEPAAIDEIQNDLKFYLYEIRK